MTKQFTKMNHNISKKLMCCLQITCFVFALTVFQLSIKAQVVAKFVSGKITDSLNRPLNGVTVSVKKSRNHSITDNNGFFAIEAGSGEVLVISYVGYKQQEIAINDQTKFNIQLLEDARNLGDVVVVGYQTRRRSDLTGAFSTANVENISKIPSGFADQALQGQVSGVRITQSSGQPGDGIAMRIRGVGSVNNNDPLYIIDGVPTQDGINFLAADDIASITVLKDAAAAAIYGARSSNGVVVITTKNGKSGKAVINYSVYSGIQTHGHLTPMATASEFKTIYNEMVVNDNAGLAANNPLIKKSIPDSITMANTDWMKAIFRTAMLQDHQLAISGGNEKTQYSISANYFKQDGIVLNSWYNRYTVRTKLVTEATDRLKVGINMSFAYYDKNALGSSGDGLGGNGGSVVRYALFRDPAIPVYSSPGVYSDLPQYPSFFGDGYNPVGLANNTNNIQKQYRGFGDVFAEYKIIKNLYFKTDFGGDVFITQDKRFNMNWGTGGRINNPSSLSEGQTTSRNMVWNNTLRYNKNFGEVHHFNFLLGTEAVANSSNYNAQTEMNFPNQNPTFQYIGFGTFPYVLSASEAMSQWSLFSLLGNMNYNYDNEFFASGTVRRDASSRFGPANKWANFFSGSVGWNLMKKKWFTNKFPIISKMKLRASYGELGNQNIGNYPGISTVTNTNNYVFGSPAAAVQGFTVSSLGNVNVKWETSTQKDIGLDIAILKDKLSLTVDYFDKVNSNMLVQNPLPMIGGNATPPYINDGSVQNKGFEFDLQYHNLQHKLQYSFGANFATLQNKVFSIPFLFKGVELMMELMLH